MNPDEMLLLDWLVKNAASPGLSRGILYEIKTGSIHSRDWLEQLRKWSRDGIEGATSALNAAERICTKANHRKDGTFRKGHKARQNGPTPAEGHLHIRVPIEAKGRWVEASRQVPGRGLSAWVIQTLNAAASSVASTPHP